MSSLANSLALPSPSLAPEPISGDSLTQFIRALANSTAARGNTLVDQGTQAIGKAQDTLHPAVDFWTKILSGDKNAISEAIAPAAEQLHQSYDTARQTAATLAPRGGGTTQANAQLPFQEAGQLTSLVSQLKPAAASALPGIANAQGGLAQILQNSGLNLSNLAANVQLTRRGQNVAETGQNKTLASSLASSLLSPFAAEGAGAFGKILAGGG